MRMSMVMSFFAVITVALSTTVWFTPPISYETGKCRFSDTRAAADRRPAAWTVTESMTVLPRDQLGDISGKLPLLATFKHTDAWIYWPQFKDRYLADRLRWQFWTLRWQGND